MDEARVRYAVVQAETSCRYFVSPKRPCRCTWISSFQPPSRHDKGLMDGRFSLPAATMKACWMAGRWTSAIVRLLLGSCLVTLLVLA
eukprot:scaffold62914_cov28-Tisochrysis_lutea.AAC.2